MQISLRDFRCFHSTDFIDVKNVNVIVGENSAGKTSFLSAIRFVFNLFNSSTDASFNRYPCFLGSYEDIAHFRGGRFGRASQFTFALRGQLDRAELEKSRRRYEHRQPGKPRRIDIPDAYNLEISFENYRSQPRLKQLAFRCGRYRFSIDLTLKGISARIKTPTMSSEHEAPATRMIGIDPLLFDLSYIRYILSDARFTIEDVVKSDSDDKTKKGDIAQELTDLLAIYDASHAQIRHDVYATAPVRTEPRRIYNPSDISPTTESDNAPILLAQMSAFDKEKWSKIKVSLEAFGQASGFFKAIDIRHLGRSKTGPFQISFSIGKVKSSIVDVGYGVSQVLPIVYEILVRESRSVFLFQQPEVHLHPKAQAELATFMTTAAFHWNHRIFIETHSDYLIDRIRMDVRDSPPSRSGDTNILYLKRNELDTTIHQLNIDENGNILNAPEGYREFFLREKARSIGIA